MTTDLSIIIPIYNEEKNIPELYKQLVGVLKRCNLSYEIIFIDDGSIDKTFKNLLEIKKRDKNINIIKFRKNFGQTAALDAGFKLSKGNTIIAMDADLQNDPQDIPRLINELKKGYDCVSGWRYNRKDNISKKLLSKFASFLRRIIIKEKIHDSGCTLKAYKKECLKDLDLYGEMHRFIPAILRWKGFKITEIKVNHRSRKFGKTKYNIKRVIKGFLDMIVVKFWMQYSVRPMHIFGGFGILSSLIGFLIGLYLTILKISLNQSIGNRPLLLLSILLILIGIQFFMFGLIADIMIKDYYKKERPYNIERII